ncbi:MAG: energy transducer TonB, partial [Granulosicoccus sp.]|nr:energy transducer TonB [Granulosicoccus sp.]
YPKRAARRKQQGTAIVGFRIYADGSIESITLVQSSGYPLLDDAALASVAKVEQFDAFPAEITVDSLYLEQPLQFVLQ